MIFTLILVCVLILGLLKISCELRQKLYNSFRLRTVPGPPDHNLILGNYIGYMYKKPSEDILTIYKTWSDQYYPIFKLRIAYETAVNVLHPDDIQAILPHLIHSRKSMVYNGFERWLGGGLLTKYGADSQKRRKLVTPTFHPVNLAKFAVVIDGSLPALCRQLSDVVDVEKVLTQYLLNVILTTVIGVPSDWIDAEECERYEERLRQMDDILLWYFRNPITFHPFVRPFCRTYWFRERPCVRQLHTFSWRLVQMRMRTPQTSPPTTILDILLAEYAVGAIAIDDVRAEIDNFIFGGHDTVTMALSYTLMLLANHPRIQTNLYDEIIDVGPSNCSYADLQKLTYMERVLKEALRLYPSVHFVSRVVGVDVKLPGSGFTVPQGTTVNFPMLSIHRNPHTFHNPNVFDPDRFLEDGKDTFTAYLPFSTGPKGCIGQKFAWLEMKLILCGILRRFVLYPVDTPDTLVLLPSITLKSKCGIKVRFVPR